MKVLSPPELNKNKIMEDLRVLEMFIRVQLTEGAMAARRLRSLWIL